MDKIMETLDNIGIIFCIGCTEITLPVGFFCSSCVCLHCVVPVSMHYRLCLVIVHIKVLKNDRLVRLSKRTDCRCALAAAFVTKTATLLGVSRAAISKVITAHTNHGKTSPAKKNCVQKLKLSEREHHTLQRTVSTNH
jgi:hypothetical protein